MINPSSIRPDFSMRLPPFRADQVGSLLRPATLADARARHRAGALDDGGLRAAEDAAITEVVARQLSDEGRAEVWPRLVAVWPLYDAYEDRADRGLRVFHLTPAPTR